eukprot:GHVS01011285.1.p1 GENE.GHVS01011285.1~~GHVS01011285.1.p1  ORF type:complete len:155 (+),score=49.09 GHVS01011285.1:43-507(+)
MGFYTFHSSSRISVRFLSTFIPSQLPPPPPPRHLLGTNNLLPPPPPSLFGTNNLFLTTDCPSLDYSQISALAVCPHSLPSSSWSHPPPLDSSSLLHSLQLSASLFLAPPSSEKEDGMFCGNRGPGARYPKPANNGCRRCCRMMRKIRKRLRTGR